MRIIKEEVTLTRYRDFGDAYTLIGRFLGDMHQHKRIPSAQAI